MNNQIEINQNAGLGSHGNTFIAEQYNGLSVADATHMAFSMFREYYPQLREELLSDLRKMLEEKLKNIPSENIVPPSPRIAVPTLQNASITEDIEIRELYAQLLANSMNETMKDGIHPGFVEIIKQLCSDEARILKYMSAHTIIPTIILRYEDESGAVFDRENQFKCCRVRTSTVTAISSNRAYFYSSNNFCALRCTCRSIILNLFSGRL